jgi:hypothetical protein
LLNITSMTQSLDAVANFTECGRRDKCAHAAAK